LLLRAAADLSPKELVFHVGSDIGHSYDVNFPCFHRAASIDLSMNSQNFIRLKLGKKKRLPAPSVEFHALESLSLWSFVLA
jgi:hypothetical protein